MTVELLTKHHLESLSLKGGCTGLSEPTLLKIPLCWKSYVAAHLAVTSIQRVYDAGMTKTHAQLV